MFIELLQHEQTSILRFHGRIASGAELEYLDRELRAIRSLEPNHVIADFRDVPSIGSTGLAFVVAVFASVTNRPGGRFVAAGLNAQVRKAFDITRLSEIIPIAADVAAGISLVRAQIPPGAPVAFATCAAHPGPKSQVNRA
jgi:anti-anti-sigma factor